MKKIINSKLIKKSSLTKTKLTKSEVYFENSSNNYNATINYGYIITNEDNTFGKIVLSASGTTTNTSGAYVRFNTPFRPKEELKFPIYFFGDTSESIVGYTDGKIKTNGEFEARLWRSWAKDQYIFIDATICIDK